MSEFQYIIDCLEINGFKEFDTKYREQTINYYFERREALAQLEASEEHKQMCRDDLYEAYEYKYAVSGGKGMYDIVQYGMYGDAGIREKANKAVDNKIKSRNFRIAKKLQEAQITEILLASVDHSTDGFNGYFNVETTSGTKKIEIDTILAGGYNIQCLHYRTLIKMK